MILHEDSGGAAFEGFSIFVEDYRSKPLNKLQLPHWTARSVSWATVPLKNFHKALFKMAEDQELLIELQYPQYPKSHIASARLEADQYNPKD